ncbi:hypothetical protein [Gordonia sp. 852002-10350_SCH5691597]|uniref:hypothetical protein n=1 Tax=Gordonia sp. 852002-10350_SCH5691597 TaxID=1834085 RepID=UPI0007EB6668|nr:hypothetical protein [Gordonia sp. 852002-10350_SCH5691597]OBA63671.1 hypothetical protein A5777_00220 [Gordonia sp. 852002-10350_SCH5691597]
MPHTDNVSLYVVGGLAIVLIGILGAVMRAIVQGKILPKSTLDAMIAERDARIMAQASALDAATVLTTEQAHTIATQADSIADFGEAQRLQVRVANALHAQVADAGGE